MLTAFNFFKKVLDLKKTPLMVTYPLLNSHRQVYLKRYTQSLDLSPFKDFSKESSPIRCLSTICSSSPLKSALDYHSTQYVRLRSSASSNQRVVCGPNSRIQYGSRFVKSHPSSTINLDLSKSDSARNLVSDRIIKTLFLSVLAGTSYVNSSLSEASVSDSVPTVSDEPKKSYSNYKIIGMPGDGRCLFHSVVHSYCKVMKKTISNEQERIHLADKLRNGVADEFIKRRQETEWFIEGDFDKYVENIRKPYVWGGEPELLMLSHLLKVPISVFIVSPEHKGRIISIADYGSEYAENCEALTILYNGRNHYDALEISPPISKL